MIFFKKKSTAFYTKQINSEYPNQAVRFVVTAILIAGFAGIGTAMAVFTFVYGIQVQTVSGNSMSPTFEHNEQVIVNKLPASLMRIGGNHYQPKRLEVVIIQHSSRGEKDLLIKRVIGLPGDRVVIKDGVVSVYPRGAVEPINPDDTLFINEKTPTDQPVDIVLGQKELYVLGDNRDESEDSRGTLGPVRIDDVVGHAAFRIWPITKFGPI